MVPLKLWPGASLELLVLLFLMLVAVPQPSRADDQELVIRLTGGSSAVYLVDEIQRIGFEGDTLQVVLAAGGSDPYPVESIARIEFSYGTAGVESPGKDAGLGGATRLFQNFPNPFSPETRIAFELPQAGSVEVTIYGPDGRLVRTLVRGDLESGRHELRWDGLDNRGRKAASGVYFCSLKALGMDESRRMILLR